MQTVVETSIDGTLLMELPKMPVDFVLNALCRIFFDPLERRLVDQVFRFLHVVVQIEENHCITLSAGTMTTSSAFTRLFSAVVFIQATGSFSDAWCRSARLRF